MKNVISPCTRGILTEKKVLTLFKVNQLVEAQVCIVPMEFRANTGTHRVTFNSLCVSRFIISFIACIT